MARKGKYADVVGGLTRLSPEATYQQKVEEVKRRIRDTPEFKSHASYLARLYSAKRLEKEAVEEVLYDANLELTALEQLLSDQYENEDTTSIRLDDGPSVAVRLEPYAQVVDRAAYYNWCVEQGLQSQMQLPWATTNSMAKEALVNGEPLPPGVSIYAKTKVVVTK